MSYALSPVTRLRGSSSFLFEGRTLTLTVSFDYRSTGDDYLTNNMVYALDDGRYSSQLTKQQIVDAYGDRGRLLMAEAVADGIKKGI